MSLWYSILERLTGGEVCPTCGSQPGVGRGNWTECPDCCAPVEEELGPDDEWGTDALRLRVHGVTPGDRTPDYTV